MATSSTFEIMNDLLCAIKQIDIITGSDQDNIIEEALIATKAINIDKFSEDIKKNIVDNIRLGLVNMYKEQQALVNKSIGLEVSYNEVDPVPDMDQKAPTDILKDVMSIKNKSLINSEV